MGGAAMGGGFGSGVSPPSKRRSSSSQWPTGEGFGGGTGGGVVAVRRAGGAAELGGAGGSGAEPVCCDSALFLIHSQMAEPIMMAMTIQKLSIRPSITSISSRFGFAAGGRPGSAGRSARTGDAFAHAGVGLDVFHPVIVHDAEVAAAEGFRHGERHLGFCLDNPGVHFLDTGQHFLFEIG